MSATSDYPTVLQNLLQRIQEADLRGAYETRYRLILKAILEARYEGLPAGFRIDPKEPSWPVALIELPTGQVSWHLEQHRQPWDGHDTATKNARITEFLKPPETTPDAAP